MGSALHHAVNWRRAIMWPAIAAGWVLIVVLFAAQWYAYDLSHGIGEPFHYYLWCCGYTWAVLTPLALWLGWRYPITTRDWRRRIPLHLVVSLSLTAGEVALEASLGWIRHGDMSAGAAFRHYFRSYWQVTFLTYWLLVAATLFYRSREEAREGSLRAAKLEAQLSEARLESLRRQLHPHFLFNTLQTAITFVHEDAARAEDILLRLSELLRIALDESGTQEIPLARELEILDLYMGIQSCRFGDRLRFEVRAENEVLACAVPMLLLQPLVENAVRHGIGRHKENDMVTVRAFRQDSRLRLDVSNSNSTLEDTGEDPLRWRIGLTTTRERLEQLYGAERASFRLIQLEPSGVRAEISLPLHSCGGDAAFRAARSA